MSEPMGVRSAAHKAMLCEAANGLDQCTLALWAADCAERVLATCRSISRTGAHAMPSRRRGSES